MIRDPQCHADMLAQCKRIAGDMEAPPMVLEDDPTIIMQDNEAPCGSGYTFDDESEVWRDSNGDIVATCPQSGFDYTCGALSVEYRASHDKEYLSAEILVAFGGPNIWIDTKTNLVCGAWAGDTCEVPFKDNIGINEALAELWDC